MNTAHRRRAVPFFIIVAFLLALVIVWYSPLGTVIVFETARKVMAWEVARDYRRAMADTYGGKTPEETVRMYIAAVEKRDFVLARRYFAESDRERQDHRFDAMTAEGAQKYILLMEETLARGGAYTPKGDIFWIDGEISISLRRYPNGIWKLSEI